MRFHFFGSCVMHEDQSAWDRKSVTGSQPSLRGCTSTEGLCSPQLPERPRSLRFFLAKLILVLVDPLDEVKTRLLVLLEDGRHLPDVLSVGEDSTAKVLDLGA